MASGLCSERMYSRARSSSLRRRSGFRSRSITSQKRPSSSPSRLARATTIWKIELAHVMGDHDGSSGRQQAQQRGGSLPGRGIAKVQANVGGRGIEPEICLRHSFGELDALRLRFRARSTAPEAHTNPTRSRKTVLTQGLYMTIYPSARGAFPECVPRSR